MSNVPPLATNVVKVMFTANYGIASNIMNRLFYTFTGTIDIAAATNIATAMRNGWVTEMVPLLSTTYILDTVTVTDLGSDSGVQVVHPSGDAGSTAAADFLPAQTAMCFTAAIGRRYRGGKPRWYQAGLHQAHLQDNQNFTATAVGNFTAAFNLLAKYAVGEPVNGGTVTNNVNLSLVDGYTWRETTTASGNTKWTKDPIYRAQAHTDPIIDWGANTRVSNQRKRGVN